MNMNNTTQMDSTPDRALASFPTFRKLVGWIFSGRMVRTCVFGLVCLATLIGLFYAEEDWRGSWAWNRFKHQFEAQGEMFGWQAFVPPPVPDDQNFAMTPLLSPILDYDLQGGLDHNQIRWRDSNGVNRLFQGLTLQHVGAPTNPPAISGQWKLGQKLDLAVWQGYLRWTPPPSKGESQTSPALTNRFPRAAQPQAPAADVLLALSRFDSELTELHEASARPSARFPVHYGGGWDTHLPHLAIMKKVSQIATLRAVAELEAGHSEPALQDVQLSFHAAEALRTEPFYISHLVRVAIIDLSLQSVWEGLAAHRWSSHQLDSLTAPLKKLDFLADYARVVRSEKNLGGLTSTFCDRERRKGLLADLGGGQGFPPWFLLSVDYYPKGWFYLNDLTAARFYQDKALPLINPAARRAYPTLARAAIREFEDAPVRPGNSILKCFGLWIAPRQFARGQTSVNLARIACALERSWQAQHRYPDTLAELVPAYLDPLPADIITGQPLHYRRTEDGQFILYSVGWDETDEGGRFATVSERPPGQPGLWSWMMDTDEQGDWPWRYPTESK